jgi:hypothetical protein
VLRGETLPGVPPSAWTAPGCLGDPSLRYARWPSERRHASACLAN